jgi:hypothetical protein
MEVRETVQVDRICEHTDMCSLQTVSTSVLPHDQLCTQHFGAHFQNAV